MIATSEAHPATSSARCRQRLLHDDWQLSLGSWAAPGDKVGFSTLEWLPARVPGHVHLDLIEQGVIADPFERMNELGCQWLDEQAITYRTRFTFTPDPGRPCRVLRFEGLDTVCGVYLNGELVAEHRNMFVPLEVDVSARLLRGENALELRFESALKVGRELRAEYFAEQGISPTTANFEPRSFVRKAQYMYGWDWGPRLVSAGVWRDVVLLEYAARIHDVHVTQAHLGDGSVRVSASTSAGQGRIVHLLSGSAPRLGDGEVAHLPRPERWYPNGLGTAALYTLDTYLCPPDFEISTLPTDEASVRERLARVALDQHTMKVGLRTVRLLEEPDELGRSFELEVNGERIFALGANWIPHHSFPSRVSRRALRERLETARDSGMNMLRVWGGGLYESEDFYDLCDELGLLVWQDFPFACAYYPDTGAFRESLREEASVNVRRLRNRASLALWCGNNENLMMWQGMWGGKERQPARYFGEALYAEVLPEVLAQLDPGRPYIPTSPQGAGADANAGGSGDQHYWDVWHGRGDWQHYRDSGARFSSEYGFASSCSMAAWRRVFNRSGGEAREVTLQSLRSEMRDPLVRWHDKTAKGYEVFLGYVALHYPEPGSLEDWVYYSQLNQRDALRTALEHYRRSSICRGSLIWQLNDCWPVQSWSLVDSEGEPKSAWFELARLHAARLLSITHEGDTAELHASLDNTRTEWREQVYLCARSLRTGQELRAAHGSVALSNAQRQSVLRLSLAGLDRRETVLFASSSSGALAARALLAEPKELNLPPPGPLTYSLAGDGIELASEAPLLDLVLSDDAGSASFLDNCVNLPSPGVLRLRYRGSGEGLAARSLAGRHPLKRSSARLI